MGWVVAERKNLRSAPALALVLSSKPVSKGRYSSVHVIRLAYNLVCVDVSVNRSLHKYR